MYIKKYLELKGSISGTVKYESDNSYTRIHVRIAGNTDNIFRVYLAQRNGEREYAGIISEDGTLSFECRGGFDCVYITKKNLNKERICAYVFAEEEYDVTLENKENEDEKEDNVKELVKADIQDTEKEADAENEEYAFVSDDKKANIKFYIASAGHDNLEEKSNTDSCTDSCEKDCFSALKDQENEKKSIGSFLSEESGNEGDENNNDDEKENEDGKSLEDDSSVVRAAAALALLLLCLEHQKEGREEEKKEEE